MFKLFERAREKEQVERSVQDYCDAFAIALAVDDEETAKAALNAAAGVCKMRTGRCLSELFCPDCPQGGLKVQSRRPGLC